MNINLPLELERELVGAALAFREAAPWRGLENSDYLLVDDGAAGLRALTVLGNGRQEYGLHAYAAEYASEWLFLLDRMAGMPMLEPTVMLEMLDGEILELGTKKEVDARDLARLERVGHRPVPRARQAWPRFRQFRRDHLPWHIDEAGARRLVGDLRRAVRWAELAPGLAGRAPDKPVALRKLPAVAAELTTARPWTAADVRWVRLEPPKVRQPEPLVPEAGELAAWRALPRQAGEWLWVDERPQMMPIHENSESVPYFPRMGVCLDGRTGRAFPPGMGPAARPYGTSAREALGLAFRGRRALPGEVRTPNRFLALALEPWLQAADIKLTVTAGTRELEAFWAMLSGFDR